MIEYPHTPTPAQVLAHELLASKKKAERPSDAAASSRSSETDNDTEAELAAWELLREVRQERDAAKEWVKWSAREWEHRRHADWPSTLLAAARALKIIPENVEVAREAGEKRS
jgi:hypothetical protein